MGYTTRFKGVLKFSEAPTAAQLGQINSYCGEDMRELDPDYAKAHGVNYIDYALTKDFGGLEWSGAEKSYGMVEALNWIINKTKVKLTGVLAAQGEEADDRWKLKIITGGTAIKVDDPPRGAKHECPSCGHKWRDED